MNEFPPRACVLCPVRQTPEVLRRFLQTIGDSGAAGFWFVDDNLDRDSSDLLRAFAQAREGVRIFAPPPASGSYAREEEAHRWTPGAAERVGWMLDHMIGSLMESEYEGALFVGSDVLVPPGLVQHLEELRKDVVCEVYWTRWTPHAPYLPQVWDYHSYEFTGPDSILRLREPGVFRVNGQGACTLVKRSAFLRGLRFAAVPGLPWFGEDRHFCVRAAVLGIEMWADTHMPAFHVYRDSQLAEADAWLADGCRREWFLQHWLGPEWSLQVRG